MEVIGPASDGQEAAELAAAHLPDLALVDIGLPDQSGLVTGRELVRLVPGISVIALTALDDPRTVEEALRSGFHGYVVKDTTSTKLLSAIKVVLEGGTILPERVSRNGRRRPNVPGEAALVAAQLTPREQEVLLLLTEGAPSHTIAARLGVTSNTVRTHVQSVLTKLQAHSRLEAAAYAMRTGIIEVIRSSQPGRRDRAG